MELRTKYLLVSIFLTLVLIGGIIFLGLEFKKINKEAVKCYNSPLAYAEYVANLKEAGKYTCDCIQTTNRINFGFNDSKLDIMDYKS